jgi:hypothetical protein
MLNALENSYDIRIWCSAVFKKRPEAQNLEPHKFNVLIVCLFRK